MRLSVAALVVSLGSCGAAASAAVAAHRGEGRHVCAAAMLASLDPFSHFLEPDLHRELQSTEGGRHGGLGLRLTITDRWPAVVAALPGSPAYRAGILAHDRIVEIEDESTRGITIFLGTGSLVVSIRGRTPEASRECRAAAEAPYPDLPLVVLVNGGSASGSEVIAGAFQDHRRALVLGMRTYGKASVQSVIPLAGGSGLRLTVARYYTPSGRLLHPSADGTEGGIKPDIAVAVSREMESKLHSQWDMIHGKGRKRRPAGHGKDWVPDEILDRARELLHARESLRALSGTEGD